MLAKFLQEVRLAGEVEDIDCQVSLAWTEANDTDCAGMPRVVGVMIGAEADNGRAPHLRFPARGLLEKLQERFGVFPASVVLNSGDEVLDADLRRLGLGFGFGHVLS